jgi:hypothetical protein
MSIEKMFLDAGFTPEYIKSREVYLKGYNSITDKVNHMEAIEKSKQEILTDTISDYFKDESKPSFNWDDWNEADDEE